MSLEQNLQAYLVPSEGKFSSAVNYLASCDLDNSTCMKLVACVQAYAASRNEEDDYKWQDVASLLPHHDVPDMIRRVWRDGAKNAGADGLFAEAAKRGWRYVNDSEVDVVKPLTVEQRQQREIARCKRELSQYIAHAEVAETARSLLNDADTYSGERHPYIHRKKLLGSKSVADVKARGHGQDARLLIPYYEKVTNPRLTTLEQIHTDGRKLSLPNGKRDGCFGWFGDLASDTVVIAEGWATAASIHDATGLCVMYTGMASNVPKLVKEIDETLMGCKTIILAGERDENGTSDIYCAKATSSAVRCRVVTAMPPEGTGKDFSDTFCHNEYGSFGVGFEIHSSLHVEIPPPPVKNNLIVKANSLMEREQQRYLIKGLLPEKSVSFLVGESQAGKSFAAFELALRLTKGESFDNYKIRREVPVLYVGLEAIAPTERRLRHLARTKGLPDNFYYSCAPMNLSDEDSLTQWVENIRDMGIENGLIIIDTFSRAMGNVDENSSKDAGVLYQSLERLAAQSGNAVMAVHHYSNKGKSENKQMMGNSKFYNNADVVIEVVRDGKLRTMRPTKSRDDELYPLLQYTIDSCDVGEDEDGDTIRVGLLREVTDEVEANMLRDDIEKPAPKRPLSDKDLETLKWLRDVIPPDGVRSDEVMDLYRVAFAAIEDGDSREVRRNKSQKLRNFNKKFQGWLEDGLFRKTDEGRLIMA